MKRTTPFLLAFVLLCAPAAWAQQKPTRPLIRQQNLEKLLRTDYYGVYVLGSKVGWARASLARLGAARTPGYASSLEISLKMMAAGARSELRILETREFDATPPYALRGGLSRETDGKSVSETRLTRTPKGFDAAIRRGNDQVRKQLPRLDYTLADEATMNLWIQQGAKIGESITVRSFEFDSLKINREIYRLAATKKTVADGVPVVYHEIEVTLPDEKITCLTRCDQKGEQVLSMEMAGLFEMRVEPEKLAKKTEFGADLFEMGKVKVDQKLGDPATISSLVLEITGKHPLNLKPGPGQSIIRNDSGAYTLKLGSAHGVPVRATPREIEMSLAETATYPSTHPSVRTLAREAVGDADTAAEKVRRLVRFVSRYITPSYTAQPLSVMDLLKARKGDCTEYALLFTTLARSVGIPTRDVGGLVYMGDDAQAFGLHAWNECVLDGQWVAVDASAAETEINPTHISFGSVLGDQVTNMFAALSKLSLRLVEVQRHPVER